MLARQDIGFKKVLKINRGQRAINWQNTFFVSLLMAVWNAWQCVTIFLLSCIHHLTRMRGLSMLDKWHLNNETIFHCLPE